MAPEVQAWAERTQEQWQDAWDTEDFDAVCCALPSLLRNARVLCADLVR